MNEQQGSTPRTGPEQSGPQVVLRPMNLAEGLQPEYVIERFPAGIGRHTSNEVELPFESVSRYHARIELQGGVPYLVDLQSANGSFVNGSPVRKAPLKDQDSIALGSLEFALLVTQEGGGEAERKGAYQTTTEQTSVHFVQQEDTSQAVFHARMPDDASHISSIEEEITNERQLKRAKQRLVTLYRLQEMLRSSTDEERMLSDVLGLIFDGLPVDRGVVLLRDPGDRSLFRPAALRVSEGAAKASIGISKTILQRCLKEKVALLARDAPRDERFDAAESIVAHRMRSVMCAPLIAARQILGFIHVDTTDAVRSFNQDDLTFLAMVATEVATNLLNMRMLQERIGSERMAAIGQTITGMAHNIKNILVLSEGGIEMMEKRLKAKNYETLDETWLVVRRGIERINTMVHEMLDYSRARTVERRRTNVNELMEELHESYAEELGKRGLRCVMDLDEGCGELMLDRTGLTRALDNLILNAMEAVGDMQGAGEVRLATRKDEEGNLVIEVGDNGDGIPAEVQPRIFVPFFTTKGSKGSGLGLAMTKKFIMDMGGKITVQSVPGKGSTFRITLMVAPATPRLEVGAGAKGEGE